jgi:hypothetical protein
MPDFDFDAFNHDTPYEGDEAPAQSEESVSETSSTPVVESPVDTSSMDNGSTEEVDKW